VLREKFSVAYRRNVLEEVNPTWNFYELLTFLEPFVNLKPEIKKDRSMLDESMRLDIEINASVAKSPLDEHYLIKLVKERPVLYDKKHEDFRVAESRKKSWDEIASIANWDTDTLQKRWRVMRDRFVRELRRSKNADSDSHISCSTFFREMLFLTHHVRSKKYEVEAQFDDSDEYEWKVEEIDTPKRVIFESISSESEQANDGQSYTQYLEECYEEGTLAEEIEEQEDEYIEEIVESGQNEEEESENEDDEEVQYEAIIEDHHLPKDEVNDSKAQNLMLLKKRRQSDIEIVDDHPTPAKIKRIADVSESSSAAVEDNNDEDVAFGNTLGCMLKKIPQHLKTSVKLKLLSAFADFEAQHKLG
jgi:hypothetical protein